MAEKEVKEEALPLDMKDWSKHQVREWVRSLDSVKNSVADILFEQDICGKSLKLLEKSDLTEMSVKVGPATLILRARDEKILMREEPVSSTNLPGKPCKTYPFCRYHDTSRYVEGSVLDVTESGASNLIEPCHEYKGFINTQDKDKLNNFTSEVIRFGAACMNSRTNGTIHFGIGDKPKFVHGQVLGVVVKDREAFATKLKSAIDDFFEDEHKNAAQTCIKPPRFVEVLNRNATSSDKCVIEVDVVPDSAVCEENVYLTNTAKKGKKKGFYVRDGGSSKNRFPTAKSNEDVVKECKQFVNISNLAQRRKIEEIKHLNAIKSTTQGSSLSHLITGSTSSLDKSHFERYVIVTNKSHPSHFQNLEFLIELDPTAVLDFDPESAERGLQSFFDQKSTVSVHLPAHYKITERVEDIANKLKLTRNTSWVFCNGHAEHEKPSDTDRWLMEKGASVRDVISLLCRKDVLPNKRFLVIFLLLSTVRERMDPLVETFNTFCQELRGTDQILCITDSENAFTSWKDLIEARCGIDISGRCIYELSFAEINGTILSLWSKNHRAIRFLPCGGESKVPLDKKVEQSLTTLEVLCVNQCEGGNEDRMVIEENFYKGEQVLWWNFYFSEQPGSAPFIKRDKFDYIVETAIPHLCSLTRACVLLNLFHVPGCGGTTLAMHVLWALKKKFRCAVLKNSNDFAEVADQVIQLLTHSYEEQMPKIPVLLLIDDFDDMEKVHDLLQLIEKACAKKSIQSKSANVILLNCMRSESSELGPTTANTVFIENCLSEKELKMFEVKLKEIEKTHKNFETFYGFMIMKNFKSEYIEGVVRNTLKIFSMNQKNAQLLAVLVLLNVYCKGSSLSVSLCEDFLDLQPKPVCGSIKVEDGFGKFSNFIASCLVEGKVVHKAVKILHSSIASQCLQELVKTHSVTRAKIADLLLTTKQFYECTQGKDNLMQDVHCILVKRFHSLEEESQFSPLIQDIANETPGQEEMVLTSASKLFDKNAVIFQLLARYYLKKKNYSEAKQQADKAKKLSKDSSYIADTSAQVIKHELKQYMATCKEEPVSSSTLHHFLKMAQSATEAFKQTQNLAKKESLQRLAIKTDNCPFNASGCLGEIQVGVLIIELLEKIPVFSRDSVRHDIMSQALSGNVKLEDIQKNDPRCSQNTAYYDILRQFDSLLYNLQYRMKTNIDYLDKMYVNLGSRFGMKDSHDQVAQMELSRCFKHYVKVFCRTESTYLLKNKMITSMMQARQFYEKEKIKQTIQFYDKEKLEQTRQLLEKEKADTYFGILNCLSKQTSIDIIEKIAKKYHSLWQHNITQKEKINFIYVNVVLSCFKLESQHVIPYSDLLKVLFQVLQEQTPLTESLALFFITVVLLWPQPQCRIADINLGMYISNMKTSYHEELKEVFNGKRPIIHFLLGKKVGYERLVHIGAIKSCFKDEEFSSMWGNGKIWKEKKVKDLLHRETGEVKHDGIHDGILADTCIPGLKLEVVPMYQSQISGHSEGTKVSFFIGFSLKGPLALDVELEL